MSELPTQRLYKFPIKSLLILSFIGLVVGLLFSFSNDSQKNVTPSFDCGTQYPVCGSDMKTYTSCDATRLGVVVTMNGPCKGDFYCSIQGPVVCGVDGKEYPNECTAVRLANVAVQKVGPCAG